MIIYIKYMLYLIYKYKKYIYFLLNLLSSSLLSVFQCSPSNNIEYSFHFQN